MEMQARTKEARGTVNNCRSHCTCQVKPVSGWANVCYLDWIISSATFEKLHFRQQWSFFGILN